MRLVGDIVESAKAENNMNVLLHSANRNNRLIDFIYRDEVGHFHAFQATLRKTHPANQKAIHDLETKVGDPHLLSLYYLVPSDNFMGFVTKPAEPKAECEIFHVMLPNPNDEVEVRSANRKAGDAGI